MKFETEKLSNGYVLTIMVNIPKTEQELLNDDDREDSPFSFMVHGKIKTKTITQKFIAPTLEEFLPIIRSALLENQIMEVKK